MQRCIEAMLFASGEPLSIKKIADTLEIDTGTASQLTVNLGIALEQAGSALVLKKLGDSFQLCTADEYADQVRAVIEQKKNAPLSPAALEVLAVIAYNQPVTKGFIEQVRGVDCSGVVSTLVSKGLIEEKGRLELPGRPLLYGTTSVFLRCFCISSLDELPEIEHIDEAETEEDTDEGEEILSTDE